MCVFPLNSYPHLISYFSGASPEFLPRPNASPAIIRPSHSTNENFRSCDSRKYTYFFPTYLLLPPKPGSGLYTTLHQHVASDSSTSLPEPIPHPFWKDADGNCDNDLLRKRRWRITRDQLELLRETAKKFEGTHNFHNFTVGREFRDRSNHRYMKNIEVSCNKSVYHNCIYHYNLQISDPAVYGETEWISVLFHGQSFMLHQVRVPNIPD